MDPKREVSSVDILTLVKEFKEYSGAIFDKAYCHDKELIRLRMRRPGTGREDLLMGVGNTKKIHFSTVENVPPAPDRALEFAMMLRSKLKGCRLNSIEQHGFDRILKINFESYSGDDIIIIFELFGEGNLSVLGDGNKIIRCLRTVRLSSRTVAAGMAYEFPPTRLNPFETDFNRFHEIMLGSETDLVRTLATQMNFGGVYAEELCLRASVEKGCKISLAKSTDYDSIYEEIQNISSKIKIGNIQSKVYLEEGNKIDVSPFDLAIYENLECESFNSFNAAMDSYFGDLNRGDYDIDIKEKVKTDKSNKYKRILTSQKNAMGEFAEKSKRIRESVDKIYLNYNAVENLIEEFCFAIENGERLEKIKANINSRELEKIRILKVNEKEKTVKISIEGSEITLDPKRNVEQNASMAYDLAKKIDSKHEGAEKAIKATKKEIGNINNTKKNLEKVLSGDWLARSSIPIKKSKYWFDRFRWFRTSDGFLVIGGHNADQNEELVKKYMSKGDKIFHAQTPGAPITILKSVDPGESPIEMDIPERSLIEAAKFAVSCSSTWKEGRFVDDVYMISKDQISKTPESGEYLSKGSFVVRGERTYFKNTEVDFAVGIACTPETRVIGGPCEAVTKNSVVSIAIEPGDFSREDIAKKLYRQFCDSFYDKKFVRQITGTDEISHILPPGGSRMVR